MTKLKLVLTAAACSVVITSVALETPILSDFAVSSAYAQEQPTGSEQKRSAGLEGRALYDEAIAVSKLLRDPSSANNTLFESETALSGELKALIYQQLREGKTRAEILDYMAERYGEAVRYQPDFNATTFLLWAAPWIAVVVGVLVFWRSTRRRGKTASNS